MSAQSTLTAELRTEVLALETDLRARVAALPEVQQRWRAEYDAARAAERTAAAWESWVDERVTLAAVAWILTTVFVRFCEDNDLVRPVWIGGARTRDALSAQQQFLRETARTNPDVTDREWLLEAIQYLQALPATAALVDAASPMWLVTPSGDAASRIISFWRASNERGTVLRDLTEPHLNTRFLGDIYQDISEEAKERYALLQTPEFIEEFILDRILDPALSERPLTGFKMIDPTCGSGHFLLGAFKRLLGRWHDQAPGSDERERVQSALDAIYGVDLNPFAVAIARFRLTVEALKSVGLNRLEEAPAFSFHLAVGDSLLHGFDNAELDFGPTHSADRVAAAYAYPTENLRQLQSILRNGQYDAVVGNPPYITVKDPALRRNYRTLYKYCKGTYALTVPFLQKFFALAKGGADPGRVGQITGSAFTKRGFGEGTVQSYLPSLDIELVIDSSGAYIPGHGTSTVIITGRNRSPVLSTVRVVLGVTAEPMRPLIAADGVVWQDIATKWNHPGYESQWISVMNLPRQRLESHPWTLSGGGALDLVELLTRDRTVMSHHASRVGLFGDSHADEAFFLPTDVPKRLNFMNVAPVAYRGEGIRDWGARSAERAFVPYDKDGKLLDEPDLGSALPFYWPLRTKLWNRRTFTGQTYRQTGVAWLSWHQLPRDSETFPTSIAWAEVASQPHFVPLPASAVLNRSAPVIRLKPAITEATLEGLLGILNSSTAAFWLRQVCSGKGGSGIGRGIQPEAWMERFGFNSSNVANLPLPSKFPTAVASRLTTLAAERARFLELKPGQAPSRDWTDRATSGLSRIFSDSVREQEELDWLVYRLYDIIDEDLTYPWDDAPPVRPGERAFEIALARRVATGETTTAWFERHGITARTETPREWPERYRSLVERRILRVEQDARLGLLERPQCKRRWSMPEPEVEVRAILEGWLLDCLEDSRYWFDKQGRPEAHSVAELADLVSRDDAFLSVLALVEGHADIDPVSALEKLLAKQSVPSAAAWRLNEEGLRKYRVWQDVWATQRAEDRDSPTGAARPGTEPGRGVPPGYESRDFRRLEYWSQRGKFDLPKERFLLYPTAGRHGDSSPVLGWGGWDHAQQALALAGLVQAGEDSNWTADRVIPLLAELSELLPWVQQWHSTPDPFYGGSPAVFFGELLDDHMTRNSATRESLAAWRPPAATRGRKAKQ